MMGDPVGDFLWGLTVCVGFVVFCIIVLQGTGP